MAVLLKIEEFGGELGFILPEQVLARLNAKEGDTLELATTRDGLLLKSYDPEFEKQMAGIRHVMDENREVLKRLADS